MAGDARIQVLINDDVDAMGGGNKDWDAVREQDPDTEYRLLAQTDTLPGDPVVMRASLAQECRDALRSTLAEHSEVLWESLTATDRKRRQVHRARGLHVVRDRSGDLRRGPPGLRRGGHPAGRLIHTRLQARGGPIRTDRPPRFRCAHSLR